MFRMDNDHVIDATLTGGPARWGRTAIGPEDFACIEMSPLWLCSGLESSYMIVKTSIEMSLVSFRGECSSHCCRVQFSDSSCRYINHSCAPNCVAEVVTFERGHKIIISSNRRIQKGEEVRGGGKGESACCLFQDVAVHGPGVSSTVPNPEFCHLFISLQTFKCRLLTYGSS